MSPPVSGAAAQQMQISRSPHEELVQRLRPEAATQEGAGGDEQPGQPGRLQMLASRLHLPSPGIRSLSAVTSLVRSLAGAVSGGSRSQEQPQGSGSSRSSSGGDGSSGGGSSSQAALGGDAQSQHTAGGSGSGGSSGGSSAGAASEAAASSPPDNAAATLQSSLSFETYQHYFALCAVTKDRPGDLREWVDYHHALGVTKFYIFDTDQRVPNGPVLQDYIEDGTVEYYHLPRVTPRTVPLMQVRLYYLCLKHVSTRHQFLGFWDVDEFLVLNDPATKFPDMLREYENFGGLVINWRLVGSSGHVVRPPGGVLRNFLKCTPEEYHENHQVKTIVNTRWVYLPTTDPHHFAYKEGKYAVNTDFEKVEGAVNPAIRSGRLVLFHYALKSATEYREKMRRGSAMGNYKNMLFFRRIDEAAQQKCRQALDACRRWGLGWCTEQDGSTTAVSGPIHRALADAEAQARREQQQAQQQADQLAQELLEEEQQPGEVPVVRPQGLTPATAALGQGDTAAANS
ncbi:hypothetical protein N2152v2_000869 [Parachlorella kessleri]